MLGVLEDYFAENMGPKKAKKEKKKDKKKGKAKKSELEAKDESSVPGTETEIEHPDYLCPLVLTLATQELFACEPDEDLTTENPYKLLMKEDIIQDIKSRAGVSDFSPVKQAVINYPEEEMLLVFDYDFTYGQCFYLVLTPEAKKSMLAPIGVTEEEEDEEKEEEDEEPKSPVPQLWVSLGSEKEIEEESISETREGIQQTISKGSQELGAPVQFSDVSTTETKSAYSEYTSYQDQSFSIRKMQLSRGIQSTVNTKSSQSQTICKRLKNRPTQYEPREFNTEEKESILHSENLRNFLRSSSARLEVALQQNIMMDVFVDEVCVLESESVCEGKADTHLKVYQTFTELQYSKDKVISYFNWHPTINGVLAVSVIEQSLFEERVNKTTKHRLNPPMIIFWSFSDPIRPQLMLECPDDVLSFHFCPADTSIIAGGCMNGQLVLWEISSYVDGLQEGAAETKRTNTMQYSEDKQQSDTPIVRYCAVSGIKNGHQGPVTEVQWLPYTFQVSREGIPMENQNQISAQIVTCSPDGCVMFWDLRSPHEAPQSANDNKHHAEEHHLENTERPVNIFEHLNHSWKPLFTMTLSKIDTIGVYGPYKFSLRDSARYATAVDRAELPQFYAMHLPHEKDRTHLDNISTKFYVGTEDGELVYTDWKMVKNDSGRLCSPKLIHVAQVHDGVMNTALRSPFFNDIFLTVGGHTFTLWKEGVKYGPLLHSPCSLSKRTIGFWSLTRPAVFFIGHQDGSLEVWNLLEKIHEPILRQEITNSQISCIKPYIISSKQHFLALSDHQGTLHILDIPWTLCQPAPNEEQRMGSFIERELECVLYFEKIPDVQKREKKIKEVEKKNRKLMRNVYEVEEMVEKMEDNQTEDLQMEVQEDFDDYFCLEKVMMEKLGLMNET